MVTVKANYGKMEAPPKAGQMPKMDVPQIGNAASAVKRPDNKQTDGRPKAY